MDGDLQTGVRGLDGGSLHAADFAVKRVGDDVGGTSRILSSVFSVSMFSSAEGTEVRSVLISLVLPLSLLSMGMVSMGTMAMTSLLQTSQ